MEINLTNGRCVQGDKGVGSDFTFPVATLVFPITKPLCCIKFPFVVRFSRSSGSSISEVLTEQNVLSCAV